MAYIVQIFTGGWDKPLYTAQEIIARLETVVERIPVEKVILGWYPQRKLYQQVGAYLRDRGIDMVLWLPTFAELEQFAPMQAAVDVWGRPMSRAIEQAGEAFVFACPTSLVNRQTIEDVYETHFAQSGFTGVFLDRVRTQSFVGGVSGVLSCGCEQCQAAYRAHGVDLAAVAAAYDAAGDAFFDVKTVTQAGEYDFCHPVAASFFEAKGHVIAQSVGDLCRRFKAKGLQVGLDVYAPLMSTFVGQSMRLLAENADFIKPMLYRRTEAPAGMGYEYRLMRQCVPTAKGYPVFEMDTAMLQAQIETLNTLPCRVYPGIEINYNSHIARTDPSYVVQSIETVRRFGADGVVLSWDLMQAPDEHLDAVAMCTT